MNAEIKVNSPVKEIDLHVHFVISDVGRDANGLYRAYLTWPPDSDGNYATIEELDLSTLNLQIVKKLNGSLGHGWLIYK